MRPRRITGNMQWCFHLAAALSLLLAIYIAAVSFSARRQPKVIGVFANFRLETNLKTSQPIQLEEWHASPDLSREFPVWTCHFTGSAVIFSRHSVAILHTMQRRRIDVTTTNETPGLDIHVHYTTGPLRQVTPIATPPIGLTGSCHVDARAVQVGAARLRLMPADGVGPEYYSASSFPGESNWDRPGISVGHSDFVIYHHLISSTMSYSLAVFELMSESDFLRISVWMVLAPLTLLPALWIVWFSRAYRLRRRVRLGLCINCGYDLRATPDACPECGAPSTPSRA